MQRATMNAIDNRMEDPTCRSKVERPTAAHKGNRRMGGGQRTTMLSRCFSLALGAAMFGDSVTAITLWPRLMKHKHIFRLFALSFALLTAGAAHAEPIIPHGTAPQ